MERLASLLRSSLDASETVSLEQELGLVKDYLDIQKTRYGERLSYEISCAPRMAVSVPPFSVQTLVDNSIKHVGRRQDGVNVTIRAAPIDGDAVVFVTDNGPGFDPGAIHAGHGLDNLHERLRAMYQDRAGLEYFREAERMTVRLRVPLSSA